MLQTQMQTSIGKKCGLRLLEVARLLVRFNHVASTIVNADQRIM
jgi:hypothetical protein